MMLKIKCEWRTSTNEQQQQQQQQNENTKMKWQLTSQKPPGGSPKQVLGVNWEFLTFYYQLKKYISKHIWIHVNL